MDNQDDSDDDEDDDDDDDDEDDSDEDSNDSTNELKQLLTNNDVKTNGNVTSELESMLSQLDGKNENEIRKLPSKPICCVCLGDRSDDSNEIVECDGCGVSVHEGCYGVSDNVSISSTNSTCSTEPWFCEACRAGVKAPVCELCPNSGAQYNGIFKETDVGKWVHLVCALYVPGVAFGEVDQLSSVTLFEMQYNKWGAKLCSLCENSRFARTGVCIGCDAGMCKTYFHVTCAQAAGLLREAHHDHHEADAADPFYAHCKVHSEKEMIKKRKRNYHTFHLNMQQKEMLKLKLKQEEPCPAQMRIQRKLLKIQRKYASNKQIKAEPWVPTQKMSRLLTTSASACKRLMAKANIMSVDVELLERQEAQIAALTDIRKKWHIAPAFSVEFIGYYLDRISRSKELKEQLSEMMLNNRILTKEQNELRLHYDKQLELNKELKDKQESLNVAIAQTQKQFAIACPNKAIPPSPSTIGRAQTQELIKSSPIPSRPISVPTAAALKMGVGFPLSHLGPPGTKMDSTRLLSSHVKNSSNSNSPVSLACSTPIGLAVAARTVSAPSTPTLTAGPLSVQSFDCGICKRCNDQHMLAKCDTCKLHYHLGCLNPPLTRHPKKSKLYGWQCSECDKSDESDTVTDLPKGPRKSRTRFNKDGLIVPVDDFERDDIKETKPHSALQANLKKRRSVDRAVEHKSSLKLLNRSLPIEIQTSATTKSRAELSPSLSKKSKLSLSYVRSQESSGNKDPLLKNAVVNIKKEKFAVQPVVTDLSSDQSLLIMQNTLPASNALVVTTHNQDSIADNDPLAIGTLSVDGAKQARKQKRKDKHKNRHSLTSDTEKSPSKEHKRKRKKKLQNNDAENPNSTDGIPKIKIKFKTLPLPGEDTPEAQFFYVCADMVRSAEEASRPTSVETVEDVVSALYGPNTPEMRSPTKSSNSSMHKTASGNNKMTPTRKQSPRKASKHHAILGRPRLSATPSQPKLLNCCVCQQTGVAANVVTCDECRKHYHFTCLDPPLKKTPKIRGYSWHCAECDPTDDEHK